MPPAPRTPASPRQLLKDYTANYLKRHPSSLGNSLIRHQNTDAREIMADYALHGEGSFADIVALAETGDFGAVGLDSARLFPARLAAAARVLALQEHEPGDDLRAYRLYSLLAETYGPAKLPDFQQGIHVQLAYKLGRLEELARMLQTYQKVPASIRQTLELNLLNPVNGLEQDWDGWLTQLQQLMPAANFSFADDPLSPPIDRLTALPLAVREDGPKVTVAITCYEPDAMLVTAVNSIANQSWRNLEILIVDDGSPEEFDRLLKECERVDGRVRLIRLPRNQGTYAARNAAMDAATGRFLTFQDSDDWCHPGRIEHQVDLMTADPRLMATVVNGLKVGSDLTLDRVGRPVVDVSMPTTMIRLEEVLDRVGYFHLIRKSADGEYLERISAAFGAEAVLHDKSTAFKLIRQTETSLSRADFGAGGWMHPAREAYMSAYRLWHRKIREDGADPRLEAEGNTDRLPVPRHLLTNASGNDAQRLDYVFATDWRPYGAPAKAIIEEIRALLATGARIGVLQLDAFRYMSPYTRPLCDPIQELVNDRSVVRVLPADTAEVGTLVVRYPPVLQFRPGWTFGLNAERVLIIANQAPSERDGSDLRYIGSTCTANAEAMFGRPPLWVPEGPQTRQALLDEGTIPQELIADVTMPCVVDAPAWAMPRRRFRSDIPVMGRHSRDHYTKWPEDAETLLSAYPADSRIDVRIMGGAQVPAQLLETEVLPTNWTAYGYDAVSVKSFLYQLDFWVYFHHPILVESFGLAVLEAMATGCVVILPPHFEPTFGEGAVYCAAEEVESVIKSFYDDFDRFRAQSDLALAVVREQFSHEALRRRIRHLESGR